MHEILEGKAPHAVCELCEEPKCYGYKDCPHIREWEEERERMDVLELTSDDFKNLERYAKNNNMSVSKAVEDFHNRGIGIYEMFEIVNESEE